MQQINRASPGHCQLAPPGQTHAGHEAYNTNPSWSHPVPWTHEQGIEPELQGLRELQVTAEETLREWQTTTEEMQSLRQNGHASQQTTRNERRRRLQKRKKAEAAARREHEMIQLEREMEEIR